MDEEDKVEQKRGIDTAINDAKRLKKKADNAKKLYTIIKFLNIKKALITVGIILLIVIIILIFFAGSDYFMKRTTFETTAAAQKAGNADPSSNAYLQTLTDNGANLNYLDEEEKEALQNGARASESTTRINQEQNPSTGRINNSKFRNMIAANYNIPNSSNVLKGEIIADSPIVSTPIVIAEEDQSDESTNEEEQEEDEQDNSAGEEDIVGVITIYRESMGEEAQKLYFKQYDEFMQLVENNDPEVLSCFSINNDNLVIADWHTREIKYEYSDNMPEAEKAKYQDSGVQYDRIEAREINYKNFIGAHALSFDYMLSLLVITKDEDFINALAELANNSDIRFTIFDNITETVTVEKQKFVETTDYKKWVNYRSESVVQIRLLGEIEEFEYEERDISDREIDVSSSDTLEYTLTTTTIDKASSYTFGLTYADSWLAKEENEYTYLEDITNNNDLGEGPEVTEEPTTLPKESIDINNDEDVISYKNRLEGNQSNWDEYNILGLKIESRVKDNYSNWSATQQRTITKTSKVEENTTKTTNYYYIKGTQTIENEGEKFKDLYDTYPLAASIIRTASNQLNELLELTTEGTQYLSLSKYLFYKCTGTDYEEDDLNISDLINLSFNNINNSIGSNQTVTYGGKEITYSARFASETKTPQELGIKYTTQTGVETTNYDACRVCNEYAAGTKPTTAIGITLDSFPKVVAKWTGGSFVEYGDWVYIDGWGYALVADCGGFTGKESDYYHLDCFVGQEGDVLDDGLGNYSALKRRCINWEGVYSREPGNRTNETIYVIKAEDAQKYIEENYSITSSQNVTEMLNFGSKAIGKGLSGAKNVGVISRNYRNFGGSWCSIYAYSLYEYAGYITLPEANSLADSRLGISYAGYWQLMDGGKHYNGYLANGTSMGNTNYLPKPGDLILYKFSNSVTYASHVGVVYEVNGNKMTTIEGNTDNGICNYKYRDYCKPGTRYSWGTILGYFSLDSFLSSK